MTSPITDETNSTDISLDMAQNVTWSLPGWDGNPGGLGVTFDSAGKRSLFYIGTDRALHQVTQTSTGWQNVDGQDDALWPLADQPNAPFAITSDFGQNKIWIYYLSGGNMTQVYASGNATWEPAIKLPQTNSTASSSPTASSAGQGLSTGAKVGVGVGVSVGGLVIIALVSSFIFVRRRRSASRKEEAAATAATAAAAAAPSPSPDLPRSETGTDASAVNGQWVDGRWVPGQAPAKTDESGQAEDPYKQKMMHEMMNQERPQEMPIQEPSHELEDQIHSQELPGDSHYPEVKQESSKGAEGGLGSS